MIIYKCKACGGKVNIKETGGFVCEFCGAKQYMSDEDFKGHEEFQKKLLSYYKAEAINKENDYNSDTLFEVKDEEKYIMANGQELTIKYMFKYHYDDSICYLARESVIYVFKNLKAKEKFMDGLKRLEFPEADNKLERCFPKIKVEIELKNGKEVVVFVRKPNFYPVELFAPLENEHLAWVISRMENICCALKYSEIEFDGIKANSIWVNPITHEGALFGDWSRVKELKNNYDLIDVRKTAIHLTKDSRNPMELYKFLNSKPAEDAYTDFENWDKVIEKGFGGHKFVKM